MPGPLPKYRDGQRRKAAGGGFAVDLPAAGQTGPPPAWPLATQAEGEAERWALLWTSPQAVAWEALGYGVRAVLARYVRLAVHCETGDAPAALLGELRQVEDRFGLSPLAMAKLRWAVVEEVPADVAEHPAARLRAVDGAGRPGRGVRAVDNPA
ncbi:hypothetical protein [Parafrankia sp. BMG5.11]|uniref:phage terminase small subunit n=1 Tax=Parafrankia sp. BMG5.11 TaxID=222540 RepID=UPI0010388B0D|nr:hypothetical protein [Parafrankia sp. BMG5.11]TCJ36863.1 hypothetical protein E0504_21540 [Parafrankia sp. BMG5.11]